MKKTIISIILAMFINIAFSQEKKLTLGFEYRPRAIVNNGYQMPKLAEDKTVLSVSQRTRINFAFERDKLKTYISVQDVRLWGDDNHYSKTVTLGNSESLRIHQAWFSLNLKKNLSIKVGRQIFNYDDERILSGRRWNDYQVTYDAAMFTLNKKGHKLDIALSWNTESTKSNLYPVNKLRLLDFIRYERRLRNVNLSAIALLSGNNMNNNSDKIYLRGTYGLNCDYSNHDFIFKASAYYQHNVNDNGMDVSAYALSVLAIQKLYDDKFSWGMGVDYLSGQDEKAPGYTGTMHNFDLLFGKRHGGYGYMDMFNITPIQGLTDGMIKTEYKSSKKTLIQADFHWFYMNGDKFDETDIRNELNKNIGQELDLTFKWKIMKDIKLQAGYSMYFMTKSFKQIKGVNNKNTDLPIFGYIMITVNPKIWETK
jgi:hypothetical protein